MVLFQVRLGYWLPAEHNSPEEEEWLNLYLDTIEERNESWWE
jgi:hypothetical protein